MSRLSDEEIEKAAQKFYDEMTAITTIYTVEFVRKDNGQKESFAAFYGKTFPMKEDMSHEEIVAVSKEKDKDILEMLDKLKTYIEEYVDNVDDFISGIHKEIEFYQFHGEDQKRMSIHDNVDYCETAEQAFEKFKYYYAIAKNPELSEEQDTENVEKFIDSELFEKIKNL